MCLLVIVNRLPVSKIWYAQSVSNEEFFSLCHTVPGSLPMGRHTWDASAMSVNLDFGLWSSAFCNPPQQFLRGPSPPCKCCDCDWNFFLELHLSLLLFLFSVGLVWGGSSFVVRYLRSSEHGRLCGFCCWQMLFALLLHEFSVLKQGIKKAKISELNLIRMDIGFLKRWDFQWSVQSKCTRSMSCE